MKSVKYALLSAVLCALAFTATIYVSCKKDPCKNVFCLHGGACNNGKCICPTGYTGTYCETDPCLTVYCYNGGTCLNGSCSCPTGYEGTNCETETRGRFIKSWSASDVTGTSTYTYAVAITTGSGSVTQILIDKTFSDNFFKHSISATVSGKNMTIAKQNPDSDQYSVEGGGTIGTDGKIIVNYTLKNDNTGASQLYNGTWQ